MGSGKSTVARALAERLLLPVIDMDELIIERSGLPDIATIFGQKGEAHFRELETSVARDLGSVQKGIISTGGGAPCREQNMSELMRERAVVVFLKAPFNVLRLRIGDENVRPLWRDPEAAEKLFSARQPIYEAAATITVDITQPVPTVCDTIVKALEELSQ